MDNSQTTLGRGVFVGRTGDADASGDSVAQLSPARESRPTKREQFHCNIIGQAVTLSRDEVRHRIETMAGSFTARGVADPAVATHKAIVALGGVVRRQALIMGFSDTFAVLAVLLGVAAIALLFAREAAGGAGGTAVH